VVPLSDENFLGGSQQLIPSCAAWQSRSPRARCLGLLDGCHAASQ
jgi:hypothetical protein